jgi:hypothetical protein
LYDDVASAYRLVLDYSGNLGVGATSPSSKLQVSGAIRTTGSDTVALAGSGVVRHIAGTTMGFVSYGANISTPGAFNFTGLSSDASVGDIRATIDASGNLGLGVTPSAWSGNTAAQIGPLGAIASSTTIPVAISANAYSTSAGWAANYITTSAASLYLQTAGQHQWFNAPSGTAGNAITFTQAMTLDANENLLVGTTTAGAGLGYATKIAVDGAGSEASVFKTSAGSLAYCSRMWNSATSGNNAFVNFQTEAGGTDRGSITYNRAGGLVAYNTTSDYRAKDILGPVADSGATIDALKVYEGQMKGATQSRPMLIAHEAQAVTPYAVTGEKDAVNEDGTPKHQQMDVSALVPLLLAELQSLRARVAQLESKP